MKTIAAGDDEPSWLKEPSPSSAGAAVGGNPFSLSGAAEPGSVVVAVAAARGRVPPQRARRRRVDDSDDDDSNEDCCCCPQDPCLIGMTIFHCASGALGLAGAAANLYHITQPSEVNKYVDIVQRCYLIAFSAIIVLTEVDWKFLTRRLRLLDLWVFRGLFISFVGLNTLDLVTPTVETPECIVGFALILCGAVYVVMGSLCLKSIALSRRAGGGAYSEIREPPDQGVYESV